MGLQQVLGAYCTIAWSKVYAGKGEGKGAAALVQCADASEAQWVVESLDGNIPEGLTEPVAVAYKRDKGKGKSKGFQGKGFKGTKSGDEGGYGKASAGWAKGGGGKSEPYGGKGSEGQTFW